MTAARPSRLPLLALGAAPIFLFVGWFALTSASWAVAMPAVGLAPAMIGVAQAELHTKRVAQAFAMLLTLGVALFMAAVALDGATTGCRAGSSVLASLPAIAFLGAAAGLAAVVPISLAERWSRGGRYPLAVVGGAVATTVGILILILLFEVVFPALSCGATKP